MLGAIAAVPATAGAVDFGFANAGDANSAGPTDYQGYYKSTDFSYLHATVPIKYERFFVHWDALATGNNAQTGCVTPSVYGNGQNSGDSTSILSAMIYAEQQGDTPTLALTADGGSSSVGPADHPPLGDDGYKWPGYDDGYLRPSDASLPAYPTDYDLLCATIYLESYLDGWHVLAPHGVPTPIEAFNEPITMPNGACHSGLNTGDCGARYFADVVQGNLDYYGGSKAHIIAGTFSDGDVATNPNPGNRDCGHEAHYMEGYICYLQDGDGVAIPGGQPLSHYNQYATSWSFHDYTDPMSSAAAGCSPAQMLGCGFQDAGNFDGTLSAWDEPTGDVWMTEAGYHHVCGAHVCGYYSFPLSTCHDQYGHSKSCYVLTATQEADAAYDWQLLGQNGFANHVFWYEYNSTDDYSWGGGLLDNGNARQSWCVLVAGYNNRGTCTADPGPPDS